MKGKTMIGYFCIVPSSRYFVWEMKQCTVVCKCCYYYYYYYYFRPNRSFHIITHYGIQWLHGKKEPSHAIHIIPLASVMPRCKTRMNLSLAFLYMTCFLMERGRLSLSLSGYPSSVFLSLLSYSSSSSSSKQHVGDSILVVLIFYFPFNKSLVSFPLHRRRTCSSGTCSANHCL